MNDKHKEKIKVERNTTVNTNKKNVLYYQGKYEGLKPKDKI